MRNAQKRHDRIVANFPSVHNYDTVEVTIPESEIFYETIFERCPDSTEAFQVIDTLVDGTMIKVTLKGQPNEKVGVSTSILTPAKKQKVKAVCPELKIKWWQKFPVILIFTLITFIIGYGLAKK